MSSEDRPVTIEILQPLRDMTKAEGIKLANRRGWDLSRTWSCYEAGALQCGTCWNCVEPKKAYQEAGVKDETIYAA